MQTPFLVALDTFVISCSVDNQLQAAACSNFMEHLLQVLPVTMVTQKPFRLALCTWPASIPSGVGMCHQETTFPTLTKGCLTDGGGGGSGGVGSSGLGAGLTLARLAVKSTHSKSCPILWRNSSTCGRFSTYTCNGRKQQAGQLEQVLGMGGGPNTSAGGFPKWFPPPAPGVHVWYEDPGFMRGSVLRCGTSGQAHPLIGLRV